MATPDPLPALAAPFLARRSGAALLTDFDGTLSAIVEDPGRAEPLPGVADLLGRLAERVGLVAVISGRPARFLEQHLGGRGVHLVGLYGMEWVAGRGIAVHPDARRWREVVDGVAAAAEAAGPPGVLVERKDLSFTLHFRQRPELEAEVRSWAEAAAATSGLVLHPARRSFELRPPVERHKGTVVAELAAAHDPVCFAGDDRGDLDAFDALDRLAAEGRTVLRVAVCSPEAPAELVARADVLVEGPEGAADLLARLGGLTRSG